ncbi:MAG: DUF6578 domain-containing protein [Nakamurella sp.]
MAAWEIECCAPVPTVGELATWRLGFVTEGEWLDPLLDFEHDWMVSASPTASFPNALCLTDGIVRACWFQRSGTEGHRALESGPVRLRGQLFASRHGGSGWDEFPATTTRVLRVQLVTNDARWPAGGNSGQRGVLVPHSTVLTDVQQSPKWFPSAWPANVRGIVGDIPMCNGVLLDLATQPVTELSGTGPHHRPTVPGDRRR